MLEIKCCICEATFPPEAINKDGKCKGCEKAYPKVKTRKEAILLHQPQLTMGEVTSVEDVRRIVREEFAAMKKEKKDAALEKARQAKANKDSEDSTTKGDK